MKYWILGLSAIAFASCTSTKTLSDIGLTSGYYKLQVSDAKPSKVYLDVKDDSLTMVTVNQLGNRQGLVKPQNVYLLQQPSFDIDVLAIPFKFRPSTSNSPNQLTADFNGNLYLGYRVDRFRFRTTQTPIGAKQKLQHHALTMGVFGGLGNTFISQWTTNYQTQDEYNGFIITRGVSLMAGIDNLTVGIGVGWDYLTDRDKDIWIYQNKPWFGLAISLNIN